MFLVLIRAVHDYLQKEDVCNQFHLQLLAEVECDLKKYVYTYIYIRTYTGTYIEYHHLCPGVECKLEMKILVTELEN